MNKTALSAGVLFAGLSVILGAFGAHALKPLIGAEQLQVFESGARYQMYHSLALLAVGILSISLKNKMIAWSANFSIIGILLFSGSLYTMTFLKIKGQVGLGGLGLITPIGGLFFILGWLFFLIGVLKKSK